MYNIFSAAQRELEQIIKELNNFLANNYKDAAHECRLALGEKCEAYYQSGKLSRKKYLYYRNLYQQYTQKMKNYHH